MAVVYDKLLGKVLLHRHDPLYLKDPNGIMWAVTVDITGTLVITLAPTGGASNTGQAYGLLLALTQP